MQLSTLLDFDSIRIGVAARTKRGLLNQLALEAAHRLGVDPDTLQQCLAARERLGSTGFGNGVAIPHGKLAELKGVYAMVARLAEPIDYKSIDDAPVDIVFLLLSPPDAGAEHLKALARSAGLRATPRRSRNCVARAAATPLPPC